MQKPEFWFFNDPKHKPEGSKCSKILIVSKNLCVEVEKYIFPISNISGRWHLFADDHWSVKNNTEDTASIFC